MKKILITFLLTFPFVFPLHYVLAEEIPGYEFTVVKKIPTSPVKDQQRTGTCWSFATTSFLESEIMRLGNAEVILSPMFFVRHAYSNKIDRYVRFQGTNNFGQGGQAHNVMDVIRTHGLVPEKEFDGKNYGEDVHVHSELESMLQAMVDVVIKNRNRKLSTAWKPSIEKVLDTYFGETPKSFEYKGETISPNEFAKKLAINPDDYIEITSYSNYPYNQKVVLEIPDNWAHKQYYNVSLDDLMSIMNHAIENGFTIAWDGDVSEKGFSYKKGLAVLPQQDIKQMSDSEQAKWADVPKDKLVDEIYSFNTIVPEILVTPEQRQETFDNYLTTDDHLMHVVGISKDQNGTLYYITKNSWGDDDHIYDGYLHMSEQYVRKKTIAIMVHKDALPKSIAKELEIKR